MVALADLLGPDSAIDLPLVVLAGLAEHGQEHDRPVGRTPVRYPDGGPGKPEPQFPDLAFEVLRCSDQGPPSELSFSASMPAISSLRL
jgi:hypothetical protein